MDATNPTGAMQAIASAKLAKVLGPERGQAVLAAGMHQLGMTKLDTADDLFKLGAALEQQGGFTATVGALLCLSAVMHGAAGRRT